MRPAWYGDIFPLHVTYKTDGGLFWLDWQTAPSGKWGFMCMSWKDCQANFQFLLGQGYVGIAYKDKSKHL